MNISPTGAARPYDVVHAPSLGRIVTVVVQEVDGGRRKIWRNGGVDDSKAGGLKAITPCRVEPTSLATPSRMK